MVYIITSKTRSAIMSQPKERTKLMNERRMKSQEKHSVETVTPVNNKSELEVHEDMDRQGGQVKEVMQATREHNEKKKKEKEKQRLESSLRRKIVKERVEKLEARDRKSGLLDAAEKTRKRGKRK